MPVEAEVGLISLTTVKTRLTTTSHVDSTIARPKTCCALQLDFRFRVFFEIVGRHPLSVAR